MFDKLISSTNRITLYANCVIYLIIIFMYKCIIRERERERESGEGQQYIYLVQKKASIENVGKHFII